MSSDISELAKCYITWVPLRLIDDPFFLKYPIRLPNVRQFTLYVYLALIGDKH